MGPSKWKSILMFDKPVVFRERRVVSREGVTHLESRPFLVRYTCACAYAHAHPYWQTWKGMKRLRVTLAPETGRARAVSDSEMGLSLWSLWGTVVFACHVLDQNSGYYITCFQNVLVGWEGCSSSWPLLPEKHCSTCGFDPAVVGQAYQVGQPSRSCCAQNIFFSLHFCCLLSKRHSTLTASFDTLSDTLYGYCTLTFNYINSYYNHFLITNPL